MNYQKFQGVRAQVREDIKARCGTSSPMEAAYVAMSLARNSDCRFYAMDCHTYILDLDAAHPLLGILDDLRQEIGKTQRRLGI